MAAPRFLREAARPRLPAPRRRAELLPKAYRARLAFLSSWQGSVLFLSRASDKSSGARPPRCFFYEMPCPLCGASRRAEARFRFPPASRREHRRASRLLGGESDSGYRNLSEYDARPRRRAQRG